MEQHEKLLTTLSCDPGAPSSYASKRRRVSEKTVKKTRAASEMKRPAPATQNVREAR
jgi:hypothetical protein